jgi:hypothetical protein
LILRRDLDHRYILVLVFGELTMVLIVELLLDREVVVSFKVRSRGFLSFHLAHYTCKLVYGTCLLLLLVGIVSVLNVVACVGVPS